MSGACVRKSVGVRARACVCVCVRERERERESGGEREGERERERERGCCFLGFFFLVHHLYIDYTTLLWTLMQ